MVKSDEGQVIGVKPQSTVQETFKLCENEKMKVRRIMKDLFDTFNSSASSTLA